MKERLGRGLEALITPIAEIEKQAAIEISTDQIVKNRYQPRKSFNPQKLQELADSIAENGVIQPLIVTQNSQGKYELIAGERRLLAARSIKLDSVPVVRREASEKQLLQLAMIENIQREDLNPIDKAKAFKQLEEEFGLTHKEIARVIGSQRATITNSIRLLQLSVAVQKMVEQESISQGHAKILLGLPAHLQSEVASQIVAKNLSVRQTEQILKSKSQKKVQAKGTDDFSDFEKDFKSSFQLPCKVVGSAEKGKIILGYKTKKQREQLFDILRKDA